MLRDLTTREASELDDVKARLCGWVHDIRVLGRIAFIILRDRYGFAQLTLLRSLVGKERFREYVKTNRESVICVEGTVKKSEQAKLGFEIVADRVEILNRADAPLPMGVADRTGAEMDTRIENRFLDLRRREVLSIFNIRHTLLQGIREFLVNAGFMEVHTPKIVATATEGGTELFPVKYFEKSAYLNQSPQLYKQILMAAGFDRVFEIAPAFRAEEHNTTNHLNEFISVDVEMSFADEEDAMKILEECILHVITKINGECGEDLKNLNIRWNLPEIPFRRVEYDEAVDIINSEGYAMEWGEDFSAEALRILGEKIRGFYFITKYPIGIKPFYVLPYDDRYSHGFDLMYMNREISSGAQRNHIYESLVREMKKKGLNPDNFEFYLRAFRYGMPPHSGWAIGLERLTMILTGARNIRECVLFPRDRTRLIP